MFDIEKIDIALYKSIYGKPIVGDYNEIWSKIKSNPEILREAVQVKRDRFDENDIVRGLTICDSMLMNYDSVDKVAYKNLIDSIYTNTDIARTAMDVDSNGSYSFLLMSLWNHSLRLTEEQKAFAVNEAMNKSGTTHGTGEYDIRYQILRNDNWSLEEKQKLIMDFWSHDETYDEFLEQWEWGVINDSVNFKDNPLSQLDKNNLYEYSYEILLKFYGDKETTDRIWDEIRFCKQMHQLRPQQWELEFKPKKKVLTK